MGYYFIYKICMLKLCMYVNPILLKYSSYSFPFDSHKLVFCFCFVNKFNCIFFRFHIPVISYGIWISLLGLLHLIRWSLVSSNSAMLLQMALIFKYLSIEFSDLFCGSCRSAILPKDWTWTAYAWKEENLACLLLFFIHFFLLA